MFVLEIKDESFRVDFHHTSNSTECQIFRGEKGKHPKDITECVAETVSTLHPNDKFDKFTGKKVAMAKGLKKLGFNVETRKMFWEMFLSKTKSSKQKEQDRLRRKYSSQS